MRGTLVIPRGEPPLRRASLSQGREQRASGAKRVTAAYGSRVVMAETLEEALAAIFGLVGEVASERSRGFDL